MHIPDNYLSPQTCAVFGAVMVPVWYLCARKLKELPQSKYSLIGVSAAFSFLLMMFNVPVPGGTTAHAIGATLAAVLIGPYAACIAISSALFIQAIIFGDGGILTFGANCFNMAFIASFSGYFLYKLLSKKLNDNVAIFIASYIGINLAALAAGIEFGVQPMLFHDAKGLPLYAPYPLSISIPAMLIPHLTIAGLAEAIFTTAIFIYIKKVSPDILSNSNEKTKLGFVNGLILALIAISPLGLLADATAWGEWGSDEIANAPGINAGSSLGFVPQNILNGFSFDAPLPDYSIGIIHSDSVGYILSAIIGVSLLTIIFKIVAYVRTK